MTPNPSRSSGDPIKLAQQQLRNQEEQKRYDKQSMETLRQVSESLREFLGQYRAAAPQRQQEFKVNPPVAIPPVISPAVAESTRKGIPSAVARGESEGKPFGLAALGGKPVGEAEKAADLPGGDPVPKKDEASPADPLKKLSEKIEAFRLLPEESAGESPIPLAHTPKDTYTLAPEEKPVAAASDPCKCFSDSLRPVIQHLAEINQEVAFLALKIDSGKTGPSPTTPPTDGDGKPAGDESTSFRSNLLQQVQDIARRIPFLGQGLSQSIGGIGQMFAALARGTNQASGGLLGKAAGKAAQGVKAVAGRAGSALRSLGRRATATMPPVVQKALAGAGRAGKAAGTGIASMGKAAASALSGLAAGASAAAAGFMSLAQVSTRYVSALNPSAVMMFQRAMHDLNAVVGVALLPVLQAATGIVRQFAAVLFPVMESIQPVIGKVIEAFQGIIGMGLDQFGVLMESLMPLIELFAELVQAIQPLMEVTMALAGVMTAVLQPVFAVLGAVLQALIVPIRMLADLVSGLTPILQAFSVIMGGLAEGLKSLFSGIASALGLDSLGKAFSGLKGVMQQFAQVAVLAVAHLARMLGMDSVVAGMIKSLEGPKKKDALGLGVIQSAQFTDFADFGRTVALESLKAGKPGEPTKDEEEKRWREELLAELKKLNAGQATKLDDVADKISGAVEKKANEILNNQTGGAWDIGKATVEGAKGVLNAYTTAATRVAGIFGFGSG